MPHFSARIGRPSVPMETYLRLMFLKHRYQLGYESMCAEVSDSISWRRFCRIDIDARGAPPDHADEDHHAVSSAGGGRAQRAAPRDGGAPGAVVTSDALCRVRHKGHGRTLAGPRHQPIRPS